MRIISYLLIILFPIILVLGNFRFLVFNEQYYKEVYKRIEVYKNFSDPKIVDKMTNNLISYFQNHQKLDPTLFSNQALVHLSDVKSTVTFVNNLLFLTSVAFTVCSALLIFKRKKKLIFSAIFISSFITFIFFLMTAFGLFTSFDFLFTKFHEILFTNQLWLFREDDTLIKLFPREFFVIFASTLSLYILITSLIAAIVSQILKKILHD